MAITEPPAGPAPDAGRAPGSEPGWGRFALALGVFVLAAFPQVIFGLQTFVYRDFGYFGYPLAYHFRESIWHGELPLWNPLNECGLPFLAQWNTQVLYPPAWLCVLFPLSWALGVFCLAHLFLGGIGMYVLANRWMHHRFAAAVAGVAYAFSGLTLNSLIWPNNIAALGWMPWVVWLVESAWREGGRKLVAAALAGGLQMLAGAPEIILLTWVMLAALLGSELYQPAPASAAARLLRFGLVVLLVAGLSAAQLLPFLDLLNHSQRDVGYGTGAWAMPATGWANLLVPLFRTHPASHGVYVQTGQYWTASYYPGAVVVVLGLWAVWRVRNRRVWVLAALCGLFLVLALGDAGRIYPWLRAHLNAVGLMRFPIKFVVLPVFTLPLLAAAALARQEAADGWPRKPFGLLWLLAVSVLLGITWYGAKFPLPDDDWGATWCNAAVRAGFLTAVLAALAFVKSGGPLLRGILPGLVVVLVWLDLLTATPLHKTVTRAVFDRRLPRELPVPRFGVARAMVSAVARQKLGFSFLKDPAEDYVSRRWALFSNCGLLENIPVLDGFYSLHLPEQLDVGALLYGGTNRTAPGLVQFLGVSQVTTPTNYFEWEACAGGMPLLSGGQKPVFADASTTLQRLASPEFDPRAEVFLPPDAKSLISATNAARVNILNANCTAHRISASVEADAPALVVAAQAFYHDWKAYMDGGETRLWHANYAFQALEVPPGKHQIMLVYKDRAFRLGALMSLVSLCACGAVWLASHEPREAVSPSPLPKGRELG